MTGQIVSVDELASAYKAAAAGAFRHGRPSAAGDVPGVAGQFMPLKSERVVLVCGALPAAGTSTMALALAGEVAGVARVVECCTPSASGLAGASSAELGEVAGGWVRSERDGVRLERTGARVVSPDALPVPVEAEIAGWTFLDCSWDLDALLAGGGWLAGQAARVPTVVVTRATVPGMRRLDTAVGLLGAHRVVAVLVGAGRRWPRPVEQSASLAVRRLRSDERLFVVPADASLALNGLTPDPLPAAVQAAGANVLERLKGLLP